MNIWRAIKRWCWWSFRAPRPESVFGGWGLLVVRDEYDGLTLRMQQDGAWWVVEVLDDIPASSGRVTTQARSVEEAFVMARDALAALEEEGATP